jgi:hypothetical protein
MPSKALPASARALLAGAIDYAGLFPPAGLAMEEAVRHYRRYRGGADAWALGRFVCPAARLEELDALLGPQDADWRVAATGGEDASADRAALARCRRADVLEARYAVAPAALDGGRVTVYRELDPAAADFAAQSAAAHASGARLKLRAGGVIAAAIPPTERVLAFFEVCRALGAPCKATAGLHHALRGEHALTYAAGAPRATMHGYLNLMLSWATLGQLGRGSALDVLERRDAPACDGNAIAWGPYRWTLDEIAALRRGFAGFGSCSFTEPLAELAALAQ